MAFPSATWTRRTSCGIAWCGRSSRRTRRINTANRAPLSTTATTRIVDRVLKGERKAAEVSVAFLAPAAMRRMNREWLGHDYVTDVITFALPGPGKALAGDVYICPAFAKEQAKANGVSLREELVRLVIHGTLHVLGYTHPEGATRTRSPMWRRQERYLKALV